MRVAHKDVVIPDHPVMKHAQKTADRIWKEHGRVEGVTITSGKNGVHGPGSWHYYGAAEDCRTNYHYRQCYHNGSMEDYPIASGIWGDSERREVYEELKAALPEYDVIWHDSHIHIEPGDNLARTWGLLQ